MPASYSKPQSIDDLVDHAVGKALDQLGIEHRLLKRWKDEEASAAPVRSSGS